MIALTVDCEPINSETQSSKEGNETLLKILQHANAKATFFVTGEFAEKHPKQLKKISRAGHEIASHGYCHNYRNNQLLDLEKDILLSKKELEKTIGKRIAGFRSPQAQYSLELIRVLSKLGFRYDSSLHPAIVPGFYYNFNKPLKPFYPLKDRRVKEIPIGVMPFSRLPIGWFWMRNLGEWWPAIGCRLLLRKKITPVLYFHSWEFTELHFKDLMPGYTRNTGKKFGKTLRKLIGRFKGQEFVTMSTLLERQHNQFRVLSTM